MENKNSIKLEITRDKDNMPEQIEWAATDSPVNKPQECKAFMLSLWDGEKKNTFRIDLWTKEMQVDEMNFFFYQSLMTMADTFQRSTNNEAVAQKFKQFANEIAVDLNILKKTS